MAVRDEVIVPIVAGAIVMYFVTIIKAFYAITSPQV